MQNKRPLSVPKLKLQSATPASSKKKQEVIFGVNVTQKNLVEVELSQDQQNDLSGLLSPIDFKDSNRDDVHAKLDELYQSYEQKEKNYAKEDSSSQPPKRFSLLQDDLQGTEEAFDVSDKQETPLRRVNDFFKQLKL